MENQSSINELLIAPCGMNCGLCIGHLRDKKKCQGCNASCVDKPLYCINCRIKNCEIMIENNYKFCYECSKLPCARLKQLDKRYRTKYGMSMIENLKYIQSNGLDDFIESEKVKWTCKNCGGIICVHRGYCISCKAIY